jgi:hypothetical protein
MERNTKKKEEEKPCQKQTQPKTTENKRKDS